MKKYILILFVLAFIFSLLNISFVSASVATSDCTIANTLRVGSRGGDVVCLQTRLGLTADGKFGPQTKTAVISFQVEAGLKADGVFGSKSKMAIEDDNFIPKPIPLPKPILPGCNPQGLDANTGKPCVPPTPSTITILSPNGGETWVKGITQTISWQDRRTNPPCPVGTNCAARSYDIKLITVGGGYPGCSLSPAGCAPTYSIANNVFGTSYNWLIPNWSGNSQDPSSLEVPVGQYKIQVCQTGTTNCDSSDAPFTITGGTSTNHAPVIDGFPTVPVNIQVGQSVYFSWHATDADNDNLSWGASFDGGPVATVCPGTRANNTYGISHAWNTAGTYLITATVDDCKGGTDRHSFMVNVGSVTTIPTLNVSLDPSTPAGQILIAGQGNITFTKIKITAGPQDANGLLAIQLASDSANINRNLNNFRIYDGTTQIGTVSHGFDYNGSYYYLWVYLDNAIAIPANTSKVLSIVADTNLPGGLNGSLGGAVRVGVAGWNFSPPGVHVEPFGTTIYGNIFTIKTILTKQ